MRFSYVILADAATAAEGKLFIHGGGIGRIYAQTFPWVHPQLALAARLELDDGEKGDGVHTLTVRYLKPDGVEIAQRLAVQFEVAGTAELLEHERAAANFALTMNNLMFSEAGTHTLELAIDGEVKHVEHLPVIMVTSGVLPQ